MDNNYKVFSKDECNKIINYTIHLKKGKNFKTEKRNTSFESCFIPITEETKWIFVKLYSLLETVLNKKVVKDLESVMINHYYVGDRFQMHQDLYFKDQLHNIIVNLNEEYEGGDFKLYYPDFILNRESGNGCVFDYTRWHGVDEVLEGERYSLAAFFKRNNFNKNNLL